MRRLIRREFAVSRLGSSVGRTISAVDLHRGFRSGLGADSTLSLVQRLTIETIVGKLIDDDGPVSQANRLLAAEFRQANMGEILEQCASSAR